MKKINFLKLEALNGGLKCSDKEGFVYGALGSALLLAPVTAGGSILMSLGALAVAEIRCHN